MLTEQKADTRLTHLSTIAQKVFAAVPAQEVWSLSYIQSEMSRTGSSGRNAHIVQGCLNSLIEAGLIIEPARGTYQRAPVRAPKPPSPTTATQPTTMAEPTTAKPRSNATAPAIEKATPIAILSRVANNARALAIQMRAIADDIETAALEIEEAFTASAADSQKLRQLQALLKG
jgi:hypothetical protein